MPNDVDWERRKERRLNVSFGATVQWTDKAGNEVVESTHTFSISDSGAGVVTTQSPPVGQKAKVTIDVGGPSGSSMGEIRWAHAREHGFLVGVSFRV
jgi:hypothetical protein